MGLSITIPTGMKAEYVEKLGGLQHPAFSFRTAAKDIHGTGKGYSQAPFYTFPESIEKFFEKDSSSKVRNLSYSEFLEEIPCIKIRSYTQDTIASEFFNILGMAIEGFQEGAKFEGNIWDALKYQFGDMFKSASELVNAITSEAGLNTFAEKLLNGANIPDMKIGVAGGQWLVEKLPYALYYSILGSETNFFAELPCYIPTGFFDSNGNYGWQNGSEGFNAAEVAKKGPLGNLKGLMTIAQSFGMNFMPFFKAEGRDNGEQFTVSFELYNDTIDHALANYHFLHTLVPHNKWMQYGLSQSPGALYDVHIPGGNRFFMCMCNISVKMKGALRKIDTEHIDKKYKNIIESLSGEKLSIPDVYSVELNFSSMFSNNFNNYIYNLAKDMPAITNHRSDGVLDTIIENADEAFKSLKPGKIAKKAADLANEAFKNNNIERGNRLINEAAEWQNRASEEISSLETQLRAHNNNPPIRKDGESEEDYRERKTAFDNKTRDLENSIREAKNNRDSAIAAYNAAVNARDNAYMYNTPMGQVGQDISPEKYAAMTGQGTGPNNF